MEAPGGEDSKMRQRSGASRDPSGGSAHAHAEPVVFAHEQHRELQVLVNHEACGIQRAESSAVIDARVAEAHDDDRTPALVRAEPRSALQRERESERAREVRGDGAGLRDDPELTAAEDLVPSAARALLCGCDERERNVTNGVDAGDRAGALYLERATPIVHQAGIGRARETTEDDVRLVP